jgi:hypothetical protein
VQAKYITDKHLVFPNKSRHLREEMPDLSYFEKSAINESAEDTMEMLKRITKIGYTHNKIGRLQSKENGFIGTKEQQKAQRNDKGRTQNALYKTQEETEGFQTRIYFQ